MQCQFSHAALARCVRRSMAHTAFAARGRVLVLLAPSARKLVVAMK